MSVRGGEMLLTGRRIPGRRDLPCRRGRVRTGWCLIAASGLLSVASAQYVYNPAAADEAPGIRYFGSAKDDRGALLPGVSIMISSQQLSFLLVTNDEGRFRVNLPLEMVPESVTSKCFKAGFQLVQIAKRLGPAGPKVTVQVDCVLRAVHAQ